MGTIITKYCLETTNPLLAEHSFSPNMLLTSSIWLLFSKNPKRGLLFGIRPQQRQRGNGSRFRLLSVVRPREPFAPLPWPLNTTSIRPRLSPSGERITEFTLQTVRLHCVCQTIYETSLTRPKQPMPACQLSVKKWRLLIVTRWNIIGCSQPISMRCHLQMVIRNHCQEKP
jgi:hypothetical protein